jgi:hypothetical protein
MYKFIHHDNTHQYDKKKRNRIAILHAQAAFPSNASSKGHFGWKMPRTEQLTIDVKSQKMNVCYPIIKFDTWRDANLFYLSRRTLDKAPV